MNRTAKKASEFGPPVLNWIWKPFIPIGEYTVIMADGGVGKTMFCCKLAAAVSKGEGWPPLCGRDQQAEPQNVLFISQEDRGEVIADRIAKSGGNLDRCFIVDCLASEGMDITDHMGEIKSLCSQHSPALVILDPWHGFLGKETDISRVNAVRPVVHKLANLAKECECAVIAVSHVNKRAQGENANNAANGSSDFVNAARSALRIVFDDDNRDARLVVHTKSNLANYGVTQRYIIRDGGVQWAGTSPITKQTLEAAARSKTTPGEFAKRERIQNEVSDTLIAELINEANDGQPHRFTYNEWEQKHGPLTFAGKQPKKALDSAIPFLSSQGYYLKADIQVKHGKEKGRGFLIERIDTFEPEQTSL